MWIFAAVKLGCYQHVEIFDSHSNYDTNACSFSAGGLISVLLYFPPGVTLPTWTACTTKAPTLQRQTTALCGTLGMGGGILWNPLSWRSDQQTLNLILFKYFIKTFYLVNLSANQSRLKQMGRFVASHLCIYKFGIIPLQPVVLWDANEKTIWPMYL